MLKSWFDWWKEKDDDVMEIRVLKSCNADDNIIFKKVKEFGLKNGIDFFGNSLFIKSFEYLEKILVDDFFIGCNLFYGLNPRRKVVRVNKFNNKYESFGKGYSGTKCFRFIPFDVESKDRNSVASDYDLSLSLKCCEFLKNHFNEWSNFYFLNSGNGHHLVYKLDVDILIPEFSFRFDEVLKKVVYNTFENKDFNQIKSCLNNFLKSVDKEIGIVFNCNIDRVGDASRILRLPGSFNWKGGLKRKVEFLNQSFESVNEGSKNKILEFNNGNKKFKSKKSISNMSYQQLLQEPLVKLLLKEKLPEGDRNHYLEMSLSYLLRDGGFDLNDVEIIKILSDIAVVQGRKPQVSFNYLDPDKNFSFIVVNAWCEKNLIPPVYPVSNYKVKVRVVEFPEFKRYEEVKIDNDKNIFELMEDFSRYFLQALPFHKNILFDNFNKDLIAFFGVEKAEYYWNYYLKDYIQKYNL